MWSDIQDAPEAQYWKMGRRKPNSIRQGEGIPYKYTSVGTTRSRETFDLILNGAWKVNGMCPGATWWDGVQKASHLLSEHEVHRLRIEVFIIGEDVLRTGIDSSKTQTIHALPHYLAYCEVGPFQIHFWEAFTVWKDCKVASAIIRIWHPVRVLEGHQRKCDSRLSYGKS